MQRYRNGMYNDPYIGQAMNNIAGLFAPTSGADAAGFASARAKKEEAKRLADFFATATNPTSTREQIDRYGVGSGSFTPTQSYYNVDQTQATSRGNNAADNARMIETNRADNNRQFAQTRYGAVSKDAVLPALPGSVAQQFALPESGPVQGNISLNQGETVVTPDGQRLEGAPKPLSSSDIVNYISPDGTKGTALVKPNGLVDSQSGTPLPQGTTTVKNVAQGAPGEFGSKLTEVQGKYAMFATRASEGNSVMDDVLNKGYVPNDTDFIAGMTRTESPSVQTVLNKVITPEGKRFYQGAQNFMTSVLRPDTGAAVTPEEFQIYGQIYIPQAGDSPEVLTAKSNARKTATIALQSLSNGGAATIARQLSAAGLPVPPELQQYAGRGAAPGQPGATPAAPAPAGAQPAPTQPATPPEGAANMLRQNPGLAAQFDAKYGEGASAKILGGGQ